ncbi:hypothetical protein [Acaryochloris marina]|uniref:Uncharacterized protein n=1 Tax=Acaryochloris marina (strain MBIC 11017) TaxID=329726 RepID=A8ZLZ3_ACAM1|nr:hypothetical protein [Acaryochloris marina]ABW31762.1 hypothetical protein AM1_B0036 [Acaryochloris marina MBIC11017]BDM83039.1 hypothetical protein AM10699_59000 [Acaryochloris marina MBIC10699]
MKSTLRWNIPNQEFEDGSKISDWKQIESSPWHLQIESGYEMTFGIYEHDGQFWKLYQARWVVEGTTEYLYRYGGQACRMTQVEYKSQARSPHSGLLKNVGDLEWIRTYEVDAQLHRVIQVGRRDLKYDDHLDLVP